MRSRLDIGPQYRAVMAIRAQTCRAWMGIPCPCPERRGTVTGIALGGSAYVIIRLGQGIKRNEAAGMAGRAHPGSTRVIHAGGLEGRKARGAVTGLARAAGRKVAGWLGQGIHGYVGTTMATCTAAGNTGMAHAGWRKCIEIGVAGVAKARRRNVVARLGEPLARRSIVAAIA